MYVQDVPTDTEGARLRIGALAPGLVLTVTRVPTEGGRQLSVFISTEEMSADHQDGEPLMQVVLNDATLYDVEPGPRRRLDPRGAASDG